MRLKAVAQRRTSFISFLTTKLSKGSLHLVPLVVHRTSNITSAFLVSFVSTKKKGLGMSEYERALSTMGDSGITWIDIIFRWCVVLLVDVAELLGISYEALNVYLFVFLLPIALLCSGLMNIYLFKRFRDEVGKTSV